MDIFSAFGLSASAGLNAYIPLLVVALLGKFTNLITLTSPWNTLESWWVIGVLIVLSLVEFFADKVPAINHVNDIIQTVIRPIAGAIVFAASAQIITNVHPVLAMIMGLFVAGTVHVVKSIAVRPAVTATTGGAGNVPISIAEDVISTIISIIAAVTPVIIAILLVLGGALIVWWIWRRINREHAQVKN
ncbi:MAG: DUF4126 domain-containing protein [Anaerolineales bacterium]